MMGVPSMSATMPPGRMALSRLAMRNLLTATTLVAMSSTNGGSFMAGTATAMGLVPSRGSAPNVGSTCGGAADMQTPTMSCGSAIMAWYAAMPTWPQRPMVTTPMPVFFAFSMAISMAFGAMMMPSPSSASIFAVEGRSRTTRHSGTGLIRPA